MVLMSWQGNIGKGAMSGVKAVKSGGKSSLHAMGITGPARPA